MLVFALMLIVGGLVVAVSLVVFLSENLFPLFCAGLAAHAALASGGGWPGAVFAGAVTFAAIATALRLSVHLITSPPLRMLLAGLVILPAALAGFCLAEAVLWSFVPSSLWRMALAIVAAMASAGGACRRLWLCEYPRDQTHA